MGAGLQLSRHGSSHRAHVRRVTLERSRPGRARRPSCRVGGRGLSAISYGVSARTAVMVLL